MELWEFHPMLVHFPIAFLTGAMVLLLTGYWKQNRQINLVGIGMLIAGVATGWLAAAAGGLAFLTVPAHTEAGHVLMYWHLGFALAMMLLFTFIAIGLCQNRFELPTKSRLALALLATVLLVVTGHLGASVVFHHGAGVDPAILSPEIRRGHSHQSGESNEKDTNKPQANEHSH